MVAGAHPEDIELFDYVEGDLPAARRGTIEVHLASCADCAQHVARVQAGKALLRQAQFLEIPPRRRDDMLTSLPRQRRLRGRSPALSPKRLLAVLTPIAAVAAVVVALATTGGNSERGSAGGAGGTENAASDQAGAEAQARGFLSVAGPADAVAANLRSKGIDARAAGLVVEVRNATRDEVRTALGSRRKGRVQVIIVHK
jgi:anti-sigma factor RsiW